MPKDSALVTVPQTEDEVAEFDWDNFAPSKMNGGKHSFSIIDECSRIRGKLVAKNAFIHGQVEGLVFAENVTVEKTGSVSGVIFCRTLNILGAVNANIVCDGVQVHPGAVLSSTLKYKTLNIAPGGAVAGSFEKRYRSDRQIWAAAAANLIEAEFRPMDTIHADDWGGSGRVLRESGS